MNYTEATTEELLAVLDDVERKLFALGYGSNQIGFAGETQDPPAAAKDRGEAQATLGLLCQNIFCSEEVHDTLTELNARREELPEWRQDQVRVCLRDWEELNVIPAEENANMTRLIVEANDVWHRAKVENDWDSFAPYIDKMVAKLIEFAKLKNPDKDPYDVWLGEYEQGADTEFYDTFFEKIKSTIVPLLAKIVEKGNHPDTTCLQGTFDTDTQFKMTREVAEMEGLNMDALVIEQSLHPFTNSTSSNHVFITTSLLENDMASNLYSTLHEGGHAMYEQGINPDFNYTSLRGGTSLGIHESISRFYENLVGRSRAYADTALAVSKKYFPEQFENTTADEWYLANNVAMPSLIRVEADELTYSLHVIIRYEVERALFAGEITAKDIPTVWAQKYHDYLGVEVPNDSEGCLQDTHWSGGSFGYFPTYALGSAYGAQYIAAMKRQGIDVEGAMASGDLTPLSNWLSENIFKYGRSKDPKWLIENACGEPFDAQYFCDYLNDKFSAIYDL